MENEPEIPLPDVEESVPSPRDVLRRRRREEPQVSVFNPRHERAYVYVLQQHYTFPPMGTVEVRPVYEPPRDDETDKILPGPGKLTFTAMEVAKVICSEENYGGDGFCIVDGTEDENKRMMAAAVAIWREKYTAIAESGIAQWEAFVADLARENPGFPPPRQPRDVQGYYKFRDLLRGGAGRKQWLCRLCGFEADRESDLKSHHGLTHEYSEFQPAVQTQAQAAEPARDDREKLKARGKLLVEKYEGAERELSVADRKGALAGDVDVIIDLELRLDRDSRKKK